MLKLTSLEPLIAVEQPTCGPAVVFSGDDAPERLPAFKDIWCRHFLNKFKAIRISPQFVQQPKRLAKGLLYLSELRPVGWNSGWSFPVNAATLDEFFSFQGRIRWDIWRVTLNQSELDADLLMTLKEAGFSVLSLPEQTAYSMDVRQGLDGYLKSLSKDYRKTFTRKISRLQKDGIVAEQVDVTQSASVESFFESFFEHHLAYWDRKAGGSYFHDPCERAYLLDWCNALKATGNLVLLETRFNGVPVTLHMKIQQGSTRWGTLIINTGKSLDYYPGIVGVYHHLANAASQAVSLIHLGPGEHGYKKGLCNVESPRITLIIANPKSLRGQVYSQLLARRQRHSERSGRLEMAPG